jgi:hypothetical protein
MENGKRKTRDRAAVAGRLVTAYVYSTNWRVHILTRNRHDINAHTEGLHSTP